MTKTPVKVALVDDHILVRDGIASLIRSLDGYSVSLVAENGREFIDKLTPSNIPDILLLDLNMPVMDGHETSLWVAKNHPEIKILVLTMFDAELLIHMIRAGVRGFLKKGVDTSEMTHALQSIMEKGIYCSQSVTGRLFNLMMNYNNKNSIWGAAVLSDSEISFLKMVASELTYKEIADKMHISPRTVDNYRDGLFTKLNIKSRVGLTMYAVRSGFVPNNF